jgi:hypothetical protein
VKSSGLEEWRRLADVPGRRLLRRNTKGPDRRDWALFVTRSASATRREIIEPRNRGRLVTEQIEAAIRTYLEVTEVGAGFGQCLIGEYGRPTMSDTKIGPTFETKIKAIDCADKYAKEKLGAAVKEMPPHYILLQTTRVPDGPHLYIHGTIERGFEILKRDVE